jgi:hypothetical protein
MNDFEFTTPLDIERYQQTLTRQLEREAQQRRTARGGLDFQIDPAGGGRYAFMVRYRINRLLGAQVKGHINAEAVGSRISGNVRTIPGVHLVCVLLLTSGGIAAVLRPAGIVIFLAAICILVLIIFLTIGIRQGLVELLHRSVKARSQAR